jgi:acyl dehydratase
MTNASGPDEALYLEDVHVGMTFTSTGTYLVDEHKIRAFAAEFDPQPFHLDAAAASRSLLGGLAASGWHTAAITMRLITTVGPLFATGIIGRGAEIAWPIPTRPGDALRIVAKVTEVTPSRSRPDRGMVSLYVETLNQRDEVVQTLKPKLVIFRRETGGA